MRYDTLTTTIGTLTLAASDQGLRHILFEHPDAPAPAVHPLAVAGGWRRDPGALAEASAQLRAYFAGELRRFALRLDPLGTPFQRSVWQALSEIGFGDTRSYSDIAQAIGNARAVRAVGAANGRNPLPIVVPCHRVIGRDGSLTGYAGGLPIKRWLLAHEGIAVT